MMKKIITPLVLCFGLFLNSATAQEGAYLNVYGAYALPAASMTNFSSDGVEGIDTMAYQTQDAYTWMDETSVISLNSDSEPMMSVNVSQTKN